MEKTAKKVVGMAALAGGGAYYARYLPEKKAETEFIYQKTE